MVEAKSPRKGLEKFCDNLMPPENLNCNTKVHGQWVFGPMMMWVVIILNQTSSAWLAETNQFDNLIDQSREPGNWNFFIQLST